MTCSLPVHCPATVAELRRVPAGTLRLAPASATPSALPLVHPLHHLLQWEPIHYHCISFLLLLVCRLLLVWLRLGLGVLCFFLVAASLFF
ncbi:hypothetical protein GUJ93_ZPchr0008g12121 [Zizania palustris]|uniref:Uncharacterized protein n=1 Tax=Zizania palustris TaxID=103762 RepID=A0A8J5RAR4_ZIZPA|nr:hypothetical protein GUJ93_ZPchr0008g12121 [Zizania palustris]